MVALATVQGKSVAWTDFISDFMTLTAGAISPEIFRRWSAIALIGGALERRVWAKVGPRVTFPNLYCLLVAPPGVGKYVVEEVRALWTEALEPGTKSPAFHVAADSMTKASLIDTLANSKSIRLPPDGAPVLYHSLLIAAEEFSVLLPTYDMEYIGSLNSIYNNKPLHVETRRHGPAKDVSIENPQLNMLGGVQPSWLGSMFPEEAWATGFARRVLMIYSPETPMVDVFAEPELPVDARVDMLRKIGAISQLYGQCLWEPAASERIGKWHLAGGPPAPQHSKLAHYLRSRTMMAIKLAIISAVSRTGKLVISKLDADRAIEWLLDAERVMPDIFRAMIGKSDTQIIEELHYFVLNIWTKNHRKPVSGESIWNFLSQRVPSDKVEKILMVAERANILQRVAGAGDLWLPKPKDQHGVE